jgi:hypothetical protein
MQNLFLSLKMRLSLLWCSLIRQHIIRFFFFNFRFELKSKIVATVTDNGADMRPATQHSEVFGVRLYSMAHGLNLAVQKGLQLWKKKEQERDATTYLTR